MTGMASGVSGNAEESMGIRGNPGAGEGSTRAWLWPWFQAQEAIFRWPAFRQARPADQVILLALFRHARRTAEGWVAHPSADYLARHVGLARSTVVDALGRLAGRPGRHHPAYTPALIERANRPGSSRLCWRIRVPDIAGQQPAPAMAGASPLGDDRETDAQRPQTAPAAPAIATASARDCGPERVLERDQEHHHRNGAVVDDVSHPEFAEDKGRRQDALKAAGLMQAPYLLNEFPGATPQAIRRAMASVSPTASVPARVTHFRNNITRAMQPPKPPANVAADPWIIANSRQKQKVAGEWLRIQQAIASLPDDALAALHARAVEQAPSDIVRRTFQRANPRRSAPLMAAIHQLLPEGPHPREEVA